MSIPDVNVDTKPGSLSSMTDGLYDRKRRILKTLQTYSTFISVGLGASVLAPTMVSMEILLETDTKTISASFTGGAVGGLCGSIACGFIYPRFNKLLLLATAMIGICLFLVMSSTSVHVIMFIAAFTGQSFFDYFSLTAAQCYLLALWENHRFISPMTQFLHATWSIGNTCGSLIIKPFLVDISGYTDNNNGTHYVAQNVTATMDNQEMHFSANNTPATLKEIVAPARWAFLVIAAIILTFGLLCLIVMVLTGPYCLEQMYNTSNARDKPLKLRRNYIICVFIFVAMLYGHIGLIECIPGFFLPLYVVKGLGWPNDYGSLISAIYFGAHGLSRVLAVPISYVVRPRIMMVVDLAAVLIGSVLFFFASHHDWIMWLAAAIVGAGGSTMFATGVLLVSEYLDVTGAVASTMFGSSCMARTFGPALTGYLMDQFGHVWFVYICCGLSISSIIVCVSGSILLRIMARTRYVENNLNTNPNETGGLMEKEDNELNKPDVSKYILTVDKIDKLNN